MLVRVTLSSAFWRRGHGGTEPKLGHNLVAFLYSNAILLEDGGDSGIDTRRRRTD